MLIIGQVEGDMSLLSSRSLMSAPDFGSSAEEVTVDVTAHQPERAPGALIASRG